MDPEQQNQPLQSSPNLGNQNSESSFGPGAGVRNSPVPAPKESGGVGGIIGIIIIILIIIAGGAYLWITKISPAIESDYTIKPNPADTQPGSNNIDNSYTEDIDAAANVDISSDLQGIDNEFAQ